MPIELFSLPDQAKGHDLSGKCAVAVDVLRAATSITSALANGAKQVFPCEEVEQAVQHAQRFRDDGKTVLLAGERQGLLIDGFDLDNSPGSYSAEKVAGRTLVFTSTNGTRALAACHSAHAVAMGSFVNLSATAEWLVQEGRPVVIVCAGTNGQPTLEDMLFGGALCQLLGQGLKLKLDPTAQACHALWETAQRQIATGTTTLAGILENTAGGQLVSGLGLQADIEFAAQVDHFNLVPRLEGDRGLVAADVDHLGRHR